ncbi:MAG: glycoside hydrolase family 3 N-terminal domain-containing protein [Actinomycetota bacterium]
MSESRRGSGLAHRWGSVGAALLPVGGVRCWGVRRWFVLGVAAVLVACGGAADDAGAPATSHASSAVAVTSTPPTAVPATTAPTPDTTAPTTAPPTTAAPASTGPPTPATTTTPTTAPTAASTPRDCVADLPLQWKAAQVVMPAIDGAALDAAAATVTEHDLGAVLLLRWPDGSDAARLAELKNAPSTPLMIAVDEEGGVVQRLRNIRELPSAREVAATRTPDDARQLIAEHAADVAALGIDVVFAPVADVAAPGGGGPIGSRAFSDDPTVVAEYIAAYVDGWAQAGVLPVLKHFPGHGAASADTHEARATTASIDELRARDLVPYGAVDPNRVGVMVGHLDVPGLTDGLPTSLSPAAIDGELRAGLGFADTLVYSDALGMDAVTTVADLPEATVLAIAAGTDIAVFTDLARTGEAIDGVEAAVVDGRLSIDRLDEAVARVLEHKNLDPCTLAIG